MDHRHEYDHMWDILIYAGKKKDLADWLLQTEKNWHCLLIVKSMN